MKVWASQMFMKSPSKMVPEETKMEPQGSKILKTTIQNRFWDHFGPFSAPSRAQVASGMRQDERSATKNQSFGRKCRPKGRFRRPYRVHFPSKMHPKNNPKIDTGKVSKYHESLEKNDAKMDFKNDLKMIQTQQILLLTMFLQKQGRKLAKKSRKLEKN